jgi:hypothetical protein
VKVGEPVSCILSAPALYACSRQYVSELENVPAPLSLTVYSNCSAGQWYAFEIDKTASGNCKLNKKDSDIQVVIGKC